MRIDTAALPQVAREHRRKPDSDAVFPGVPADKANDIATTKRPDAAILAASEKSADQAVNAVSGQLAPAGLLAAQARFQAMNADEMNRGQHQAFESISRNIARYQNNHPVSAPEQNPVTDGEPAASVDIAV